jgi:glyoxylase-like metal-dependent hydrolase (beta-lactamase superfamily II)
MDEFQRWSIGDLRITAVPEFVRRPAAALLPDATPAALARHASWLPAGGVDNDGIVLAIQSFVIEAAGQRILVDTCIGNCKIRQNPRLANLQTDFLPRLERAGFPPQTIDLVLCTHMHSDHVGWNTRLVKGEWLPTFQNATYLFGSLEYEYAGSLTEGDSKQVMADSVLPVIEHGQAEFVDMDAAITPELGLMGTPGHTAGHVSLLIDSRSARAMISGDVFHHPSQIAEPAWGARNDHAPAVAQASREMLRERCLDETRLVIGTHFVAPSAGHIARERDLWTFTPLAA